MPLYEYRCPRCRHQFAHLWKTIPEAASNPPPVCPACAHPHPSRVVSAVAVLGSLGGLTPGETAQIQQTEERLASITPKSQIEQLQAQRASQGPT